MITDEFGNKGEYIDKTSGNKCLPDSSGYYDKNKCYFDMAIRSMGAVGSFGVPIHTLQEEQGTYTSGLPNKSRPMYIGDDLLNKCDTKLDVNTCNSNANCTPSPTEKTCQYIKGGERLTQDEWVDKQTKLCKSLKDDKCNDNKFCSLKNKECSLDDKYNIKSGLNRDDEFLTKTLDDVLGDINNNGRVPDIYIVDNVTKTKQGDVIMKQDNQETAVKGLLEETNLSNLFFSNENTQVLQDTIRYDVYKRTNLVIDYQSENELYIVMRSILLQYGNFRTNQKNLVDEIQLLNRLVVKYCGKEVGSNVLQYKGYLKDLEHLPVPLDRPGYTARKWSSHDLSKRNDLYTEQNYTMHGQTHKHLA